MIRVAPRRLEPFEPFAEVALHRQATAQHQLQCSVNGGGARVCTARPQLDHDLFGGKVLSGPKYYVRDCQSLSCDREIVLAQVVAKGF